MKKVFAILILTMMTLTAWADNTITLSAASGHPGDEVTVTASLANTDAVVAAELKIPLNDYLTYVDGSAALNAERSDGHFIAATVKDNVLTLYVYSLTNAALKDSSGELCSFNLKLGKEPATYTLQPEVMLSDASSAQLECAVSDGAVTLLSPKLTLTTSEIDFGHQPIRSTYSKSLTLQNSGNELLTVSDIQTSASELSMAETNFTIAAGSSRSVTVTYAPVLRGSITESISVLSDAVNGTQKATVKADPYSVNILSVIGASGNSDSEVTVGLSLQNMEPITGVQCSFTLPDGLQYVDGSVAVASRAEGMSCRGVVSSGKLTLFLYSSTNIAIAEGNGQICTFRVLLNGKSGSYRLTPADVVLGNITLENMVSSTVYGTVTIKSPTISGNSTLDMGSTDVTQTATSRYTVSNTGKIALTISKVNCLAEGYSVSEELPVTIEAGKSTTLTVNHSVSTAGSYSTTMNIYSNDPATRMKSVIVKSSFYEPNSISILAEQCSNRTDQEITLNLDNYTEIVAAQMDIHCTADYTISNSDISATSRLNGLSATVTNMGGGTYRLVIFSMSNTPISDNSGSLLTFVVKPSGSVLAGSTLSIDNIMLSNISGINMSSSDNPSVVLEDAVIPGDVNCDGNVDIVDLACLISYLNGNTSAIRSEAAADVDGSDGITIADVPALQSMIIGKE